MISKALNCCATWNASTILHMCSINSGGGISSFHSWYGYKIWIEWIFLAGTNECKGTQPPQLSILLVFCALSSDNIDMVVHSA